MSLPEKNRKAKPEDAFKTCSFCGATGFVWFKTAKGRFMLALPHKNTLVPNPYAIHLCPTLSRRRTRLPDYARSHKPNTWRLGKSPSSYR